MAEDIENPETEIPAAASPETMGAETAETGATQAEDPVTRLTAENADLKDRLLRAMAEMENVRRRAQRDKQDASQFAIAHFAREMLGIADNFRRALSACPPEMRQAADDGVKAVLEGVEATERQLLSTLEHFGVKPIDTADGKFDPHLHQAIAEVPAPGKPKGSIVTEVQTGFMIGERLLRPAMVTVANGAAPDGADAPQAQKTEGKA